MFDLSHVFKLLPLAAKEELLAVGCWPLAKEELGKNFWLLAKKNHEYELLANGQQPTAN